MIEKSCQNCKKVFFVNNARNHTAKYCSHSCSAKRQKNNKKPNAFINCEHCEKEVKIYPCEIGMRRFCSHACNARFHLHGEKHWNWKGGIYSDPQYKKKYKSDPEVKKRYAWHTRERYRLKKGAEGSHSLQEWMSIKIFYGFMCLCCKRTEPEVELCEDHITPITKGGSNYIENIQPLCRECNSRKYTKTIDFRNKICVRNN